MKSAFATQAIEHLHDGGDARIAVLLHAIADAYGEAAIRMEEAIRQDAEALNASCTLDHAGMRAGRCLACGAKTPA